MRMVGPVAAKLPVGIDFLGRPFDEAMLIRIASAYEAATKLPHAASRLRVRFEQCGGEQSRKRAVMIGRRMRQMHAITAPRPLCN